MGRDWNGTGNRNLCDGSLALLWLQYLLRGIGNPTVVSNVDGLGPLMKSREDIVLLSWGCDVMLCYMFVSDKDYGCCARGLGEVIPVCHAQSEDGY